MTLHEFMPAIDGYLESQGVTKEYAITPLTQSELDAMIDTYQRNGAL
jgi:hypothetical protein